MKEQSLAGVLEILDSNNDNPVLFTVSSRFNSHLNLLVLKHLVKDKGQKGVYLTVDRPSDIMKRLLLAKKIDPSHVTILDPISKVSGLTSPHTSKEVTFIDNPFFQEVMHFFSEEGHAAMKTDGVDFIMIDNLSALSCYMDTKTMGTMLTAMARWTDLNVLMCVDDINPKVHDQAKSVCTREVRFNEHMVPEVVF
jgi:hypothetical protein